MRIRTLLAGAFVGLVLLASPGVAHAADSPKFADKQAQECADKLEKGGTVEDCQKAPNPILPANNELIWGGLAFIVLFGLLAKLGYPAVKAGMDARAERIRDSLDEAERAKNEAESVLAEYQRQLADARTESARIIDEARGQAEQVRRDLTARAEAEAAELRQRNAEAVAGERDRVMGELQGQVAALAVELAEKVVESNLDREANMRLIENYINSVGTR